MEVGNGEPAGPTTKSDASSDDWSKAFRPPTISLPKGGGAIHGLGEKFSANPVTGTGSLSVPIATSPGRSGFGPQLSVSYDSGAGNGPFGFGWNLSLPTITRKTDKGLPQYHDAVDSDTFLLSGAEDLVPAFREDGTLDDDIRIVDRTSYRVRRYRPRIEGSFALIECWTNAGNRADVFWRSITRDNVTAWYGKDADSRIHDPADASRVFSWLICQSHDDKGNVIVYGYRREDGANVNLSLAHERNRGTRSDSARAANRYLKHIWYGNRTPYLPELSQTSAWPAPPATLDQPTPHSQRWMFEVVFDYDEDHVIARPPANGLDVVGATLAPAKPWTVRADPFSIYRSGFEVRTYRLCRRVLMFHHFPDESGVGEDCLVRSTDFHHDDGAAFSFLRSVTHSGYKRSEANYLKRSLPPVEFQYTEPRIDPRVHEIAPESLENVPAGLDGVGYQWVDLDSEGLSGILTEQATGWFYKRNLSPVHLVEEAGIEHADATFAPVELVASTPNAAITGGNAQLLDLANDGRLDLVMLDGPTPGFYERDADTGWEPFRAFTSRLNRSTRDPNLRFIDLDGNGHADVLITDDDAFTWHPSLGEDGFGPAVRVDTARDEERGPALVFADGTQSIYLADMSGDGLTDLVRIRNGEVCYWPNLGYGRFGAKVTMDNAPWLDAPDQFEQRRVQLADVDGSGVTDILYLHGDGVRIYFNRSGNGWDDAQELPCFPALNNVSGVAAVDLLGNGTTCLVWSSPLPNDARRCMRYVDLMSGQKPHLLVRTRNNLGTETEIQYAPSTKFYLQDKLAGRPWITRLPFPVHVVERTTVTDQWRNTAFSSTYSYHHGYFDGMEREFRGFGRVEQTDVEDFHAFAAGNARSPYITDDLTLYQPPVRTITWFHTGAALDRERILNHFQREYFPRSLAARPATVRLDNVFSEKVLPEPVIDAPDLTDEEWREALRACKGMTLRQEVYELDVEQLRPGGGGEPKEIPVRLFSAATHNCTIRRLQPRGPNPHAVFLVTESEAATYHYELDLRTDQPLKPDPRVAHTLNLKFDRYGNVEQSIAVGYPRWRQFDDAELAEHAELIREVQREQHVAYTETIYTGDAVDVSVAPAPIQFHRLCQPCETQTFELTGFAPRPGRYFELGDFRRFELSRTLPDQGDEPVTEKAYHELPQDLTATKRLVEHGRTLFFKDDLGDKLPLGSLGRLGLPYEQYKLASTKGLLAAVYTDGQLDDAAPDGVSVRAKLGQPLVCGYTSGAGFFAAGAAPPEAENEYWMRSGIAGFEPDAADHFYLPRKYTDPFGNPTLLELDDYDLQLLSSTDARGNKSGVYIDPDPNVGARLDYRVLAPAEMVDASGNRTETYFDVLGMVVASAVKGKGAQGDDLLGFNDALANPDTGAVRAWFDPPPLTAAAARAHFSPALLNASTRFLYHFGEKLVGGESVWCDRPAGACGIVRERHAAALAVADRPGPLQVAFECSDGMGTVLMKRSQAEPAEAGGPLRWIVSGKTVLNNKGKPVKQYEPYFSAKASCCAEGDMHEEVGVTPLMYYDAVGRLVRTELPDGTLSRAEFSPWFVRTFDQNDTIEESAWYRERLTRAERGPDAPEGSVQEEARALMASVQEKRAAQLAAAHAGTPAESHLDSVGREVIAIAHNGTERHATFTRLDAEGKPLWIRDALGNLVMQYMSPSKEQRDVPRVARSFAAAGNPNADVGTRTPTYDIAGNLLFQHSMDAGDRWMLSDAAGKPMVAWDRNERQDGTGVEKRFYFTEYDELRRPKALWLRSGAGAVHMVERSEYQDALLVDPNNLNGQMVRHYDPSGRIEVVRRDFKGNVLETRRRLNNRPTESMIDWNVDPQSSLEAETFTQIGEFDALSRMTRQYNWHRAAPNDRVAVYEPEYGERGTLVSEKLTVRARKTANGFSLAADTFQSEPIREIRYDAKGQRELLVLGNGTRTRYRYDEKTFRLRELRTTRPNYDPPFDAHRADLSDANVLQQLRYTYDPVGNVAEIYDEAYKPAFFQNAIILPRALYEYDALDRLVRTEGREDGALRGAPPQLESHAQEVTFPVTPPDAQRKYVQSYRYDAVGNIKRMRHEAGPIGSWTRHYAYAYADAAQPASNRLWRTWERGTDWNSATAINKVTHVHDTHGNVLNLAAVAANYHLRWDHRDMLAHVHLGGGGDAYYQYDVDKRRTRKLIEDQNGLGGYWERVYLPGYELYRRYTAADPVVPVEEIESHHLSEGSQRVLLVDDVVVSSKGSASARPDGLSVQASLFRYQYSNHLGSACAELDADAALISYEEYHPYGTSAYRATNSAVEAPPKRYRFTGMERDEESGLAYHGARYCALWLARWTTCDPAVQRVAMSSYLYCRDHPLGSVDLDGRQDTATEPEKAPAPPPPRLSTILKGLKSWSFENLQNPEAAGAAYQQERQVDALEQQVDAAVEAAKPPSLLKRTGDAIAKGSHAAWDFLASTAVGRWVGIANDAGKQAVGDIGASTLTESFGPVSAQGRGYESLGTTPRALGRELGEATYEQVRDALVGKMGAAAASALMAMIPSMSSITRARIHHIATKEGKRLGFAEEFKALFAIGGMTLEDPANKVILDAAWHRSSHSTAYHLWVYSELSEATEMATVGIAAGSPAYQAAFSEALKTRLGEIAQQLIKEPDMVTHQWWKPNP